MNIQPIQNSNFSNYKNNNEAKTATPLNESTKNYVPLSSNPKYYQAMNNVHFGSTNKEDDSVVFIPNKKGDIFVFVDFSLGGQTCNMPVLFKKRTVDEFLSDEKGQITNEKLITFVNVFKGQFEEEVSANKRRYDECIEGSKGIEELEEQLGEIKENFDIESLDEDSIDFINEELMKKSKEENDAISEAFENIENEDMFMSAASKLFPEGIEQKRFMSFMAGFYRNLDFKYYKEEALSSTENILSLSRTKSGYDLSNLEEKKTISDKIKFLVWDTGDNTIEKEKISTFIKNLFLKSGSVDLDYVKDILSVLKAAGTAVLEVEKTDKLLSKCYEKDPENKRGILESTVFFAKRVNTNEDIFEKLVLKTFNPKTGKYSEKRAEKLMEFWNKFNEWMDKRFEIEDSYDNDLIYMDAQKEVTLKYIDEITDEATGEIKKDPISEEDFIKKMEKDYL